VALLENWVKSGKENQKLFLEYKKSWNLVTKSGWEPDSKSAFRCIESSMDEMATPVRDIRSGSANRPLWRIAAAILVLMAVGYLLIFQAQNRPVVLIAETEVISIRLVDGSEVTLNRHAKLSYPKKFKSNERRIAFEGEGFFDIAKDQERHFIIDLENVTIQVLGTSFYIGSSAENAEVEVVVETGKVAMIAKTGEKMELSSGQKGVYSSLESTFRMESNTDLNLLSWKSGRMVFENSNLSVVAKVLSNTYHIQIDLDENVSATCSLTAIFDNQPLDDVLIIIEETLNLEVKKLGDRYLITGNGCN
jgi:ferric-dicitrate binding protein FerR (iron transport regulator)